MKRVSLSAHHSQSRCDSVKLVAAMRSASVSVVEEMAPMWNTTPISRACPSRNANSASGGTTAASSRLAMLRHLPSWPRRDRKSTRLNSSHDQISYAVFCLKKKKRRLGVALRGDHQDKRHPT